MSEQETAELDRLKKKRSGHRGVVSRMINEANSMMEGERNERTVSRLKMISAKLEEKLTLLKTFDESLLALIDVEEVEDDIMEADVVSDKIDTVREEIELFVREPLKDRSTEHVSSRNVDTLESLTTARPVSDTRNTEPVLPSTVERDSHSEPAEDRPSNTHVTRPTTPIVDPSTLLGEESPVSSTMSRSTMRVAGARPKLPKLYLPKFTGDITKFQTFWDGFNSAIHMNSELSPIDKFNYLKALLDGSAANVIQGLSLTEDNYLAAVELVKERYGKPQKIIATHVDELMRLPNCSGDKLSQLRLVYDRVNVKIRCLDSLGMPASQYGCFLIPIIMSKISDDVKLQIARVTTRDVWDISELMRVLKAEVEARELSDTVRVRELTRVYETPKKPKQPFTASTLIARESSHKMQCAYCKGTHYSSACDKVTSSQTRKQVLLKEGRCFLCLSIGHRASECTTSRRCRKCGRRHHQSICEPPSSPADNKNSETATENVEDTTSSVSRTKSKVLLQTARTKAFASDGTLFSVRMLLDSGSQRSYVTNNLMQQLQLQPLQTEHLNLNTFGNDRFNKKECDVVQVRLLGSADDIIAIKALSFPSICSPLPQAVDLSQFPSFQGLELADSGELDSDSQIANIDLLIGSDHYWDVVTGDIVRGDGGLVAVSSKFGWLVSGPTKGSSNCVVTSLMIEGSNGVEAAPVIESSITRELKRFWELESLGITEEANVIDSLAFPQDTNGPLEDTL